MIVRIILILTISLLIIKIYQHFFQNRQNLKKKKKKKTFDSVKKNNVKDAEFEDIKSDNDV